MTPVIVIDDPIFALSQQPLDDRLKELAVGTPTVDEDNGLALAAVIIVELRVVE